MMRSGAALCAAACLLLSGCSEGRDSLTVQASFADVGDLAERAPVFFADVRAGKVTDIRLKGNQALVVMELYEDADVPEGVIARVRRTSALGERVIDLVMPENLSASAPPITDGATIEDTEVRADLENLVVEGSEVFGAIGASEIATMVDEGAQGFGGRGEQLAAIIRNFRDITRAYSKETDDIESLLASVDKLNRDMAAQADAHREAVQNTARAIDVLQQESGRLEKALASLARLATGSRAILDAHFDEMDRFFDQTETILAVLAAQQSSLEGLLRYAPRHNRNTQMVEYAEFNQILQQFVICGMNDNPDDPARRCIGEH